MHGIPDSRILQRGDIINCDITVLIDGRHGDCSRPVQVTSSGVEILTGEQEPYLPSLCALTSCPYLCKLKA
jgi:methionine aminopeptidase